MLHYSNGQWTTVPDEQGENEDYDAWIKRVGYTEFTSIGVDDAGFWWLAVKESASSGCLVEFSDGNVFRSATTDTLGDALDVMARWAPIVTAGHISAVMGDLYNLDQQGIVSQVMAAAAVNSDAVAVMVKDEQEQRAKRRLEARDRRKLSGE